MADIMFRCKLEDEVICNQICIQSIRFTSASTLKVIGVKRVVGPNISQNIIQSGFAGYPQPAFESKMLTQPAIVNIVRKGEK